MHPTDLPLWRTPGRPALTLDGRVIVAQTWPDLAADHNTGVLHRLTPGAAGPPTDTVLTTGPRDVDPVISADGGQLAFRRAPAGGPAQVWVMPVDGGEARQVTDAPLGVRWARFLPDGRILFTARVPEAGRYGTADGVGPDAEPARLLTRLSYRSDGEGFVLDKPVQGFVVDPSHGVPGDPVPPAVQLTDEPGGIRHLAVAEDGAVLYTRTTAPDAATTEIVRVAGPLDAQQERSVLVPTVGDASDPVIAGDRVYFVATEFSGFDGNGRTAGLWWAPSSGGVAVRMTDPETVQLDRAVGPPVVVPGGVLVAVQDRGTVGVRLVPDGAVHAVLHDLPVILAGPVVLSFSAAPAPGGGDGRSAEEWTVAAVVSDTRSAGDVVTVGLTVGGDGVPTPVEPAVWTDWSAGLRAAGLREPVELTGSGADGYPVHGWLLLPEGDGPHPVLLVVHGGPHSAYTPALFDEVQVYAAAGYAVVFGNPRGSSGYGEEHGRTVLGRLGTVDVADVLALLDLALERRECDASRVGVMGGSYGGFMTTWLAAHAPERFVAGISERAVNAWDSFAGSSDIGYHFATSYIGADRDSRWRMSPLAYADRIDIPLFIIHSEQDWRCPVEQAQRLFVELSLRGAPTEMLLFPGEGHELSRSGRPRHRLQRFTAILSWWERHLPVR